MPLTSNIAWRLHGDLTTINKNKEIVNEPRKNRYGDELDPKPILHFIRTLWVDH